MSITIVVLNHIRLDTSAYRANGTSSAGNSFTTSQAGPNVVPKAKTALEASKHALSTLASATGLLPYGNAVSMAMKGVLTIVDVLR